MEDQQSPEKPRRFWNRDLKIGWAVAFVTGLVLIDIIGIGFGRFLPWLQSMTGGPEAHTGVGKQLVFLELQPLTGNPPLLSAADLQGHAVLLNFWGTWCPPCRSELPHVAALSKRLGNHETFRLAAISYSPGGQWDGMESLRGETTELLKRLNLDLPTYADSDSKTLAAVDQVIGFEGFPTTVLLDRHGVIRAVWSGYRPGVETEIEQYVDKILSEIDDEQERQ